MVRLFLCFEDITDVLCFVWRNSFTSACIDDQRKGLRLKWRVSVIVWYFPRGSCYSHSCRKTLMARKKYVYLCKQNTVKVRKKILCYTQRLLKVVYLIKVFWHYLYGHKLSVRTGLISVRCIPLSLRSKTQRRATRLLPTWIYSCQSVGTVNFALPFTTSVPISISILQTFRSWVATSHPRQPMAFLSHN